MLFGELTQQHINWFLALIHDKDLNTWDPCNNWDHGGPLIEMWEVNNKGDLFQAMRSIVFKFINTPFYEEFLRAISVAPTNLQGLTIQYLREVYARKSSNKTAQTIGFCWLRYDSSYGAWCYCNGTAPEGFFPNHKI